MREKKLRSIYLDDDLDNWIKKEGEKEGRSFSNMAVYLLEESRRVREHNKKARQDRK